MIEIRNVSKKFQNQLVLNNVSLCIEQGEQVAIIGSSGSGKTTLLKLLNGLDFPSQGKVLFRGKTITHQNHLEIKRQMGFILQDGGLFPHLNAEQNILLMPTHLGFNLDSFRERLKHLCSMCQFPTNFLSKFPKHLSGGQKQRVGLMRGLILDPDVLLLDEPLGALDPLVRASLQEDLKHIFDSTQKTSVLVTHDLGEAKNLANKIILMSKGKIEQIGDFEDFIHKPASKFVEDFISAQKRFTV